MRGFRWDLILRPLPPDLVPLMKNVRKVCFYQMSTSTVTPNFLITMTLFHILDPAMYVHR